METHTIKFGRFVLDSLRHQLLINGKVTPLEAKSCELLEFLILRGDDFVSREEILEKVWPDLTVSPGSVAVRINKIREIIGFNAIVTQKRPVGYRFVLPIDSAPADMMATPLQSTSAKADITVPGAVVADAAGAPAKARAKWRWRMVGAGCAVALVAGFATMRINETHDAPRLSIVVLPFSNRSGEHRQDYQVDAVTDELIAELARLPGSMVIARETAEIYLRRNLTAREIGRALGVRYLLSGTVEPGTSSVHIAASLTDTENDSQIWSTTFTVPTVKVGDAGEDIVGRIASALDGRLVQAEIDRVSQHGWAADAIDLFYRARSILDHGNTIADYEAAQALLEEATAKQENFAHGWAELAWILALKNTEVDDPDEPSDMAEARAAVKKALALAPSDPLALAAQGRIFSIDGDYAEAIMSAKAALAFEPHRADAELVLAYANYYSGHLDDAIAPLQTMIRLNPEGPASKTPYQRLGTILVIQGRGEEALEALYRSLAGETKPDPGQGQFGRQEKSRLLIIAANEMLARHAEAAALYDDFKMRWPNRTAWRIGAISPRTIFELPGFKRFLDLLVAAGMPMFADEEVDSHVPPTKKALAEQVFQATPNAIPGGRRLNTAGLIALLRDPGPKLIIDVGTGTWVTPGAIWRDKASTSKSDDEFVDTVSATFMENHAGSPIIVMSDGVYDSFSYNAALHLISENHPGVVWYRGGEEAWAKNRQPGVYMR